MHYKVIDANLIVSIGPPPKLTNILGLSWDLHVLITLVNKLVPLRQDKYLHIVMRKMHEAILMKSIQVLTLLSDTGA